jgi:hypothetical protein
VTRKILLGVEKIFVFFHRRLAKDGGTELAARLLGTASCCSWRPGGEPP